MKKNGSSDGAVMTSVYVPPYIVGSFILFSILTLVAIGLDYNNHHHTVAGCVDLLAAVFGSMTAVGTWRKTRYQDMAFVLGVLVLLVVVLGIIDLFH